MWTNNRKSSCTFSSYESLISSIRLTDRDWNSKCPVNKLLQHITLCINADINLVYFRRKPIDSHHQCPHPSRCFLLKFKFQSSLVKLLFEPDFDPIILFEFKNTWYVLTTSTKNIAPYLINQPSYTSLNFMDTSVTSSDIYNIITNNPLLPQKDFSIAIYSSFTFILATKSKHSHLIGWYQGHNNTTLHVFVTPIIASRTIVLAFLDSSDTHKKLCCFKNIYCSPHITEGTRQNSSEKKQTCGDLLNQNYCVCEHPETKRFFVPNHHSFKPLGK